MELVILMGFLWLIGVVLTALYQIFAPIFIEIARGLRHWWR